MHFAANTAVRSKKSVAHLLCDSAVFAFYKLLFWRTVDSKFSVNLYGTKAQKKKKVIKNSTGHTQQEFWHHMHYYQSFLANSAGCVKPYTNT